MVDQALWRLQRRTLYLLGELGLRVQDLGFDIRMTICTRITGPLANLIVATALNSLLCSLPSGRKLAHELR